MGATIRSIAFDCAQPTQLAKFWADALTYTPGEEDDWDEVAVLNPPDGHGPRMLFLKVPEGKMVKNRIHLDLHPSELMEAEVERLVALGAFTVRVVHENPDDLFTVMQDPEGNEFCVESPHGAVR